MHMDISQGNFCASQRAQNERPTTSTLNERGLYPYRKTFSVRTHGLWNSWTDAKPDPKRTLYEPIWALNQPEQNL
jgi:hypothetical protein